MPIQYDSAGNDINSFPEHQHVWMVVQIEDNPVAVVCKICERTQDVSQPKRLTEDIRPVIQPRVQPISLHRGARFLFEDGGNAMEFELDSYSMTSDQYGGRYMALSLNSRNMLSPTDDLPF